MIPSGGVFGNCMLCLRLAIADPARPSSNDLWQVGMTAEEKKKKSATI